MPRIEIDLNPVTHITADAIGQPGKRVFYIQGQKDDQVVTLIVEKVQIQTLALGLEDFLSELSQRFPDLPEASAEFDEVMMHILPPVDPLFRVGELALGYDSDNDTAILIAREITNQDEEDEQAEDEAGDPGLSEESDANVVRFWCTRAQLRAMCRWGLEVAAQGRPICPYCGQPMDPEGHFCPKRNGHKK
jgi:uncharacterized repeat protein (TIGR03847 family)